MTCLQTQDLLHAYLDDELDVVRHIEIERHLDHCQTCSQTREDHFELRSLIREQAPYFNAPDLLVKRIQQSVREAGKTKAKSASRSDLNAAELREFVGLLSE